MNEGSAALVAVGSQNEENTDTQSKTLNPLLCQRCQAWDDIWGFEPKREDPRSLEELSQNVECLVCRAVVTAVETRRGDCDSTQTWPSSRIYVRNDGPFWLDNGFFPAYHPSRVDATDPTVTVIRVLINLDINFLSHEPESPDELRNSKSAFAITPQVCLHYSKNEHLHLSSVEPWEIPFFDVSLLKTWIQGCEAVHGAICVGDELQEINDLPLGFRVIDIHSMRVAKPVNPVRFVALSYMWQEGGDSSHAQLEKKNLNDLEAPHGLANVPLPSIILDAISLCRDLGETCLWVDRLCIVQDDAESKHGQIRGMDKIYRSAAFSIIAALNHRDARGIPGCRGQPRRSSIWHPPRSCEIEGRGIRSQGMSAHVDPSLWNRRGWTFQERILSRRRLFITEFQVIYECSRGQANEEFTYSPRPPLGRYDPDLSTPEIEEERQEDELERRLIPAFSTRSSYDSTIDYNINYSTSVLTYFRWIEDYTSRHLSFGSDILIALLGVGNYLTESLGSGMILGLPEKYFSQALMWSCFGVAQRRTEMREIPSWSWAWSLQRADYYWLKGSSTFQEDLLNIASLVYFYYQDPDLSLRKLDVEERWTETKITIKKIENMDLLPELQPGKYLPGEWRSNRTWRECPHNPWHTLAHLPLDLGACRVATSLPGSLVFNTTIASLKLAVDQRDIYSEASYPDRDVAICNTTDEQVGLLNKMSPKWIDKHVGDDNQHEFIVLCGALKDWRSRKTLVQYSKDFDLWNLHVMMVERVGVEGHVVRRVDVGWVSAHKWKDCNPRWETIILC